MKPCRLLLMSMTALAMLPVGAWAQSGGVPAYDAPAPVTIPERDGEVMEKAAKADNGFGAQGAVVQSFAQAYNAKGKPKLALYWNRQLSEALSEWYSEARVVSREESNTTMSGELNLDKKSSTQNSTDIQSRVREPRRAQYNESFEWEFQDAFLNPFLEAGTMIIDRAAMLRLTGADMDGAGEKLVETRALQGKADYLMEILVSPNWKSSTGYELRTRILDIKTGAIVAMVNSKNLKEWNPKKQVTASNHGFSDPLDDDDDDSFGPQGEARYKAGPDGFHKRKKPPKLPVIAQNLAYNTMNGLMRQWTR